MKCRLSSQLPIMSKLGIPLPKKKKKKTGRSMAKPDWTTLIKPCEHTRKIYRVICLISSSHWPIGIAFSYRWVLDPHPSLSTLFLNLV